MTAVAGLFCLVAILYSAVGFGGGSSYTALLVLLEKEYALIPIISLCCNIVVVSGNVIFALRHKLIEFKTAFPLVALSVPLSFMGGAVPISELLFVSLLAVVLFGAAVQMLRTPSGGNERHGRLSIPSSNKAAGGVIGGGLGFISGLVGIGGGIFLAPVLHALRWERTRNIAALCSLFILANSCAGLLGQLTKLDGQGLHAVLQGNWGLIFAVFIGGIIGRNVSFNLLSETVIKRMTAVLILFVAVRLAFKALQI